jgi:hypothetical protein
MLAPTVLDVGAAADAWRRIGRLLNDTAFSRE